MYKQMIPADVIAREVQFGGATRAVNHRAPRHEVSDAQMVEAASNPAVARATDCRGITDFCKVTKSILEQG
jgi:hypothetical protein